MTRRIHIVINTWLRNRNMYLWDIQFKIWYTRVARNAKLFQMNIKDTEHCEYCEMRETNVHAFV